MARLTFDITVSLDGFVAGPNQTLERPLGDGGERLHEWMFELASFRERHGMAGGSDVSVAGGASVAQQYLKAGLLDELQMHLVPLLLGGGVRLFDRLGPEQPELQSTRVIESPAVTHLRYRVVK